VASKHTSVSAGCAADSRNNWRKQEITEVKHLAVFPIYSVRASGRLISDYQL
jgi:hypothetical protein